MIGFDPWSISSKGFEDILPSSQTTATHKSPVGTANTNSELCMYSINSGGALMYSVNVYKCAMIFPFKSHTYI